MLTAIEGGYEPRRGFKRGPSVPTGEGEEANNVYG